MIEFPATVVLYQLLSRNAGEKGRTVYWGVLGIALWFLGEVLGFVLIDSSAGFFLRYVVAIALAVTGGVVAWAVVRSLPPVNARLPATD